MLDYGNSEAEKAILEKLKDKAKRYNIKSKTVTGENIELSVELRIKSGEIDFVNELKSIDSVSNAVLISYNGDYAA